MIFQGVTQEETDDSNQRNQKWTTTEMEKYMRNQGETCVKLGLVDPDPSGSNSGIRTRHFTVLSHV